MLRFLGKTTGSAARNGGSCPTESIGEGLSTWELVNAPQSDYEDIYSYASDDDTSDGDGSEFEPNPVEDEEEEEEEDGSDDDDDDDIMSIRTLSVSPPMTFLVEMTSNSAHDYAEGYDDDDDELHDVDDDDMYDHEVDDELVPWKLKDRFGKQRIKKMGKRTGPKLGKSKRLSMPYYDNRPGFLYGKFRGRY